MIRFFLLFFFFSFLFLSLIPLWYRIPFDPRAGGPPAAVAHKAHNLLYVMIGIGRQHPQAQDGGLLLEAWSALLIPSSMARYCGRRVQYLPLQPETQAKSDDPNPITPYASGSTLFAIKPIVIITKKKRGRETKNPKSKSKPAPLPSLLSRKKRRRMAGSCRQGQKVKSAVSWVKLSLERTCERRLRSHVVPYRIRMHNRQCADNDWNARSAEYLWRIHNVIVSTSVWCADYYAVH